MLRLTRRGAGSRFDMASRAVRRIAAACAALALLAAAAVPAAHAAPAAGKKTPERDVYAERRVLFDRVSMLTGIPWHHLAAIDQYERTLTKARPKSRPKPAGLIAIYVPPERWAGELNPDENETNPAVIRHFGGIGLDGNGDGRADRTDDEDILWTVAQQLLKSGTAEDDFAIGLWEYYHNTRAVQRVLQFSALYAAFDRLDLDDHAFPLPVRADYSYRDTWGAARGWGGYRIHEGTDIFADYGVPVRSTCYGVVETKGWNRFGGWRIGIRDIDNVYHYFAHLSGYDKNLKPGDIVKPGQVIGWVGSSGYGKPGTSGKFPPHLHFGLYRDRGLVEWAFDPYPLLKKWEREDRQRIRNGTYRW
ncbi:MAG: peptidase M23 [Thermobacillus sp.]|uniref:M23 family metallopeptidase n=1 Tax=Thermobacillus sp. TaxID=2108467 RepID=UPI000E3AF978|nr:M23 family metallopeptidase [Thermobacillus sp.]REK59522.1 MAG: peptidase M23 [Thermobacillus sp.]